MTLEYSLLSLNKHVSDKQTLMLALFIVLGAILVTGLAIPAFADKVKVYQPEDKSATVIGTNKAAKDNTGENTKQYCQSSNGQKCEKVK